MIIDAVRVNDDETIMQSFLLLSCEIMDRWSWSAMQHWVHQNYVMEIFMLQVLVKNIQFYVAQT